MNTTAPGRFFVPNDRQPKPRSRGLTEIRGPYYSVVGPAYLQDVLETMGAYVDSVKFAGGSFVLMPEPVLRRFIEIAHEHDVLVSTGGFIERVLTGGPAAVDRYLQGCRDVGFDIIEVSSGFITIPVDDWLRLIERVQTLGLKAKPEIGIQFGAGGATAAAELASEGTRDVAWMIHQARRFLEAGVEIVMVESEGMTENVSRWRMEIPGRVIDALGMQRVMFEAADPEVFGWYIKNFGPDVNLFVDHSQIIQLECLRAGLWGTKSLWGRVVTYQPK